MVLWHYTSTDVLASIFSKSKPTLRACHINFLNDSVELKHGLEAIKSLNIQVKGCTEEHLQETIDDLLCSNYDPHIFSFSLSETKDSLYQWLACAPKELGISLGFEFSDNRNQVNIPNVEDVFALPLAQVNEVQIPKYRKCTYFSEHTELDITWFKWNSSKTLEPQLLTNAMFLKHQAFHFEQEHRLFFHPMPDSKFYVPAKFFGKKPYIEFNFEPCVLKYIYISPRGNKFETERLVAKMVKTFDIHHVQIKVSSVPFRE